MHCLGWYGNMETLIQELLHAGGGLVSVARALQQEPAGNQHLLLAGLEKRTDLRERIRRKVRAATDELMQCRECFCDGAGRGDVVQLLRANGRAACSHVMHLDCALAWMRRSHTCPVCRAPVDLLMHARDGAIVVPEPQQQQPAAPMTPFFCIDCQQHVADTSQLTVCTHPGCNELLHAHCYPHGVCVLHDTVSSFAL